MLVFSGVWGVFGCFWVLVVSGSGRGLGWDLGVRLPGELVEVGIFMGRVVLGRVIRLDF